MSQPSTTSEFLPVHSLQRWAGLGLIAVEAAMMAVAWHTSFLPILGAGGAFLGVFLKKRFSLVARSMGRAGRCPRRVLRLASIRRTV